MKENEATETLKADPLFSFEISPKALIGISLFQSEDESRLVLNSTLFELTRGANGHSEINLVATDGRRLGLYRTDVMSDSLFAEIPEAFSFSVELTALRKLPGIKKLVQIAVHVFSKHVEFRGEKYAMKADMVTGPNIGMSFPNWRGIIPLVENRCAQEVVILNFEYVASFVAAAKIFSPRGEASIRLRTHKDNGPIEVELPSCREFFGIVMPMKRDDEKAKGEDSKNNP